jgi:TolB-like protein/Tfp pilus assembly protein PilF
MELLERAVELDPGYVWAWVRLAWTHVVAAKPGWSQSPSESIKKAVEISQKVLVLDESDSDVCALLGLVYLIQNRYEQAITEGEKSLELGPTNAQAHVLLAVSMNAVGRFDDAIELVKKAMRLHPYYPAYYLQWVGGAYRMTGRYEDALTVYKQLLDRSRKGEFPSLSAHLFLADVYAELGREEEARTHAAEVLRMRPGFSLELVSKISTYGYKDPAHLERRLNALHKAGIPETPPLPLPDKPSIAVLPFVNMSDDPKQEYFSDGITEEIITALSNIPKLFVIARTSSFKYKGKEVGVRTVGRELGVRYVLEGSVRKAADEVRITAQLIDAKTNKHLWAERYDRDMKDVFAVQDEITQKVVTALQVKLTEGEQALVYSRGTTNLQAYLRLLKGREQINRWNIEGNALARETIKQVISLDPKYAVAYYLLAVTHNRDVFNRSTSNPRESIAKAIKLTQKAIVLDDSLAEAHGLLGWLYVMSRQHEKGIAQAEQALALNPNSEGAYKWLGVTLNYAGKHEEAITLHKKAIRLNPFPPTTLIYLNLACDYRDAERYEEVIPICRKALQKEPDLIFAHTLLASSYAQMGKLEEARAEAAEVLRIDPKFSVGYLCKKLPYKYDVDRKRVRDSLLKAGLPD